MPLNSLSLTIIICHFIFVYRLVCDVIIIIIFLFFFAFQQHSLFDPQNNIIKSKK